MYTSLNAMGADVADAIREKDGTNALIPVGDFGDRIRAIPQEAPPPPSIPYTLADLPVELQTGTLYTFLSSAGDLFFSSATANIGIWRLNRATGSVVQVYSEATSWRYWHEDRFGNIFVSGSISGAGVLWWNGSAFVKVHNDGYSWQHWFESAAGETFCGSGSVNGIIRWNNSTKAFDLVYSLVRWQHWFETADGKLFCGSSTSGVGSGIVLWNPGTLTFQQVYTVSSSGWQYWLETTDNRLLVGGGTGVLEWDGIAFGSVWGSGSNWMYFFECAAGIFCGSSYANSGVIWLKPAASAFKSVYGLLNNWRYWKVTASGKVFCGSSTAGTGIILFDPVAEEFIKMAHPDSYGWQFWVETKYGELFCGSSQTNTGIVMFDPVAVDFVSAYGLLGNWSFWHEQGDDLFCGSPTSAAGIVVLDRQTMTFENKLPAATGGNGSNWSIFIYISGVGLFCSSTSAPWGIVFWNTTMQGFDRPYTTGSSWSNWRTDPSGDILVGGSANPTNAGILLLDQGSISFTRIYHASAGWELRDDGNGGTTATNIYNAGRLAYDAGAQRFGLTRVNYSGRSFGSSHTMYSSVNQPAVLHDENSSVFVPVTITAEATENGAHAYALDVTGTKILLV